MFQRHRSPSHTIAGTVVKWNETQHLQWRDRVGFAPFFPFHPALLVFRAPYFPLGIAIKFREPLFVFLWLAFIIMNRRQEVNTERVFNLLV